MKNHDLQCQLEYPPGDEIYRNEEKQISIFQVDGVEQQPYC